MATYEEFTKIEIRVGTVVRAEALAQARKPAIKMWIDFGQLGVLTSSAQITRHYDPEQLVGSQVLAVTNFPPRKDRRVFLPGAGPGGDPRRGGRGAGTPGCGGGPRHQGAVGPAPSCRVVMLRAR